MISAPYVCKALGDIGLPAATANHAFDPRRTPLLLGMTLRFLTRFAYGVTLNLC